MITYRVTATLAEGGDITNVINALREGNVAIQGLRKVSEREWDYKMWATGNNKQEIYDTLTEAGLAAIEITEEVT